MKNKKTITLKARAIRHLPEFSHQTGERYIALVDVRDIPLDIPTAPNPREPNINRKIWRRVKKELMNESDCAANLV